MPKKKLIYIVIILFIAFISLLFLIFYYTFYPAYLSYSVDCHQVSFEIGVKEIEEKGYEIGGYFNSSNNNITLFYEDEKTIKHEKCHQNQFLKNRFYSCNNPLFVYLNELECYFYQYS